MKPFECSCGNTFTDVFEFDRERTGDADWWRPFAEAKFYGSARFIERVLLFRVGDGFSNGEKALCECHAYLLIGTRHGYKGIDFQVQDSPIANCPCPPCKGLPLGIYEPELDPLVD